jgi:hypothetical protein
MIEVEGYKMFNGTMWVTSFVETPKNATINYIEGSWLYKPEYDCWYCNGRSYPACICTIVEDKGDLVK